MRLFERLLGKKRKKTVVWGIRVPPVIRNIWQMVAELTGVPANRLVYYALGDWVKHNHKILRDEKLRAHLASEVNKAYFDGRFEDDSFLDY
jgi:hypothetical protein